jgi:23S rRNA (uracil1939-C5)-methyltransferase
MDQRVTAALARSGASRIGYVSCDPGTMARDLQRLEGSHRLVALIAFDQFPQTAHVECLATLERR